MSWLDEEMKANAERNSQPPTVPDGSNQSYFYYDTESKRYVMVGNNPDVRKDMEKAMVENPDPTANARAEQLETERRVYHQQTFHNYVGGGTPTAAWSFFWKEASDNNLTSSIQGDEHGIYSHLYGQYGYGIWENPMKQWEKEIVQVPCVQRGAHGKATTVTAFGCPKEPDPTKFFYKHSPQEGGTGINNDGNGNGEGGGGGGGDGLGTGTIVLLGAAGLGAVALLSMRR